MEKKRKFTLLLAFSTILGLAGCGPSTNLSSSNNSSIISSAVSSIAKDTDKDYYSKINQRATFDYDNERNINEDFTNGMNNSYWYAIDGAWHTDSEGWAHNGVQSRNLYYTTDSNNNSYLAIKARGFYNTENPSTANKPEGGCIISKNHLGPGRYEITMASMPREGGVTAMWTYCTTTGSEYTSQNEIDIELGGTSSGGTQYEEYWTTSWTTKTNKQTDKVDVSSIDDLGFCLNDGKMHKYTFDWYTEYPGEDEGRVDWFVDGVFTKSISGSMIPDTEMPLWIGVWFPPAWAGNPAFDTDYLLIDSVNYTAFSEDSDYYESCRAEAGYTKHNPNDLSIPTISFDSVKNINKLSNNDFESLDVCPNDGSYYGWSIDSASKGSVSLSDTHSTGSKSFKLTAGNDASSSVNGEYLIQKLSNAYAGYNYTLSIDAKLEDASSSGNIEIYYRNKTNKKVGKLIIPVDSTSFKTYTQDITMPSGSSLLEIDITSESGSVYYDNASLIFKA